MLICNVYIQLSGVTNSTNQSIYKKWSTTAKILRIVIKTWRWVTQPPWLSDCSCIIRMVKYHGYVFLVTKPKAFSWQWRIFLTTRHASLPVSSSEVIDVLVVLEGASEGISSSDIAWIDRGSTEKSPIPLPPGLTVLPSIDKTLFISSFWLNSNER